MVPSLKCSPSFDQYMLLLVWTLGPIALYVVLVVFIVVSRRATSRGALFQAVNDATDKSMTPLSLVQISLGNREQMCL